MAEIRVLQTVVALEGGIVKIITDYCENMDRSKVNFDYLVYSDENDIFSERIKALGGKIHVLPFKNIKNPIKKQIVKFKSHYELFRQYDYVQVNASHYVDRFFAIIAKKAGVKHVVLEAHLNKNSEKFNLKKIYTDFFKIFKGENLDAYFAVSEESAKYLFSKRIYREWRFRIVNNGIDTEKYRFDNEARNKYRREMGLENKLVLFHSGRFARQKNHDFLIDVFSEVHKQNENVVLLLAGEGELMPDIKSKVNALGLSECVYFLGNRSDIPQLLSASDVFVFPSLCEGLGISAVEAQCSGLHTVCSDEIPPEATVSPLIERLPLNDSAYKWAERILTPYERTDMSEEVRKAGFDIKQCAKEIEQFYVNIGKEHDNDRH